MHRTSRQPAAQRSVYLFNARVQERPRLTRKAGAAGHDRRRGAQPIEPGQKVEDCAASVHNWYLLGYTDRPASQRKKR